MKTRAERLGQLRGKLQDALSTHEEHISALWVRVEQAQIAQQQAAETLKTLGTQVETQNALLQVFRGRHKEDTDLVGSLREVQGELNGLNRLLTDQMRERDDALASRTDAEDWERVQCQYQQVIQAFHGYEKYAGTVRELERALAETKQRQEDFDCLQHTLKELPNPVHELAD